MFWTRISLELPGSGLETTFVFQNGWFSKIIEIYGKFSHGSFSNLSGSGVPLILPPICNFYVFTNLIANILCGVMI